MSFPPDTYVKRLNLQPGFPLNVKDISATGDGQTDDFNALQQAVLKAGATGTLYFPAGTYRVGSTLTISCACIFAFGAVLEPDSGVTVTLAGPVTTAPNASIVAGQGTVSITGPMNADGTYNVKAFGAVGDGVANDTAALQAAVNQALVVIIPAGVRIRITSQVLVPAGVRITGDGEIFVDQSPYVRGLRLNSNCIVDGITFRGNGTATAVSSALSGGQRGVAISAIGSAGVRVRNCKFYDFISIALNVNAGIVAFGSSNNAEVSGCYFDVSNDGFIDIDAGYTTGDLLITQNVSYSNSDLFVSIASVGSNSLVGTSLVPVTAHHIITDNIAIKNRWQPQAAGRELGRHGILVHYAAGISHSTISNNKIGNVSRHGIYFRGANTSSPTLLGPDIVIGNTLTYCGSGDPSNYSSGIRLEATLPTTVANNHIYYAGYFPTGVAGSSPGYGIECVRGMQDAMIANNVIFDAKDGGINLSTTVSDRTLRNVRVTGNMIRTSTHGVAILVLGANCIVNDIAVVGNTVQLTGANYNGRAAGIVTEIASTTTGAPYSLQVAGNTVVGQGTSSSQYGITLLVSAVTLSNKCIIEDNTFRDVEYGFACVRYLPAVTPPTVSYVTHRQIGTAVQLLRNRFVSCGTALQIFKTAATQLAVVDDSNVYESCVATGLDTTVSANTAVKGRYLGLDANGIPLVEFASSATPTVQQYYQGDRVVSTAPAAGGYIGRVCTTSGTPGTWKQYGEIEP